MIELIEKIKPNLNKIDFICDVPLNSKLEKYDLINNYFNKSNTTAIIGNPGSGKTSLLIHLVNIYKKCFHSVYVFMAEESRNSIKKSPFDVLPEDQLFDEITPENIDEVYIRMKEDAKDGYFSLVIFDDLQDSLKDPIIVKKLGKFVANRRHLRAVNILILQNFKALDAKIRKNITNLILFNLDKTQMKTVYDEVIKIPKKDFIEVCDFTFQKPHDWLFIHIPTQIFYKEFDEIKIK